MAQTCEVWFYHLERTPLEQALPELLEKTLAKGWKAVVRAADPRRVDELDAWLWTFRDDSFLPHGTASEVLAERQPVLLTSGEDNANGADALFLVDGAEPGSLEAFKRCIVLFDGRDEAARLSARERWTAVKGAGHPVSYWRQGPEGRWEKQA